MFWLAEFSARGVLTTADVNLSVLLLLDFCKRVQCIYGELAVTPNMHMRAHIKQAVLDYGPVYAFWVFSYERYNGIYLATNPITTEQLNRS